MPEPHVLVFYVDAGGGHRSAMQALAAAAGEQGCPWHFDPVNFQSLVAPLDFTRRITGLSVEETYNFLLRHRLTWTMDPLLRLLHLLIRLRYGKLVRRLAGYLEGLAPRPVLVLSLMPNFNGVLRDACRQALPGVRFLVLLTDLADYPPHFWIEPGIDRVIVGSDAAVDQARAAGLPAEAVVRVSGMVLHPRFYADRPQTSRAEVRAELGFGRDDLVLLLLFGGKGSPEMLWIARGLLDASPEWRVVAICGQNPPLVARMQTLASEHCGRLRVTGFTERVAEYLAAADLLITKPGPGSLAEAWQRRLPAVVIGNRATIPQERFNARFVRDRELGVAVTAASQIPGAVRAYLGDPARQERVRRNLAALPTNRAVYEVIEQIGTEIARKAHTA